MDDWEGRELPNTGSKYYYHKGTKRYQLEPPYYEILGLDPLKFETYHKSDIKAAWFARSKSATSEEEKLLVREAYEVLRHTDSRTLYNQKNLCKPSQLRVSSALEALATIRL